MNIIVIANCHVQPIADGLMLHPQVENLYSIPIHLINTEHFTNALSKIKESNNKNYTILQFDKLLSKVDLGEEVMSRVDTILTFTNIYFSGLHPDLTYIGQMGKRVISPLGDYHSKICFLSFMKGYTEDTCINLFNMSTYEKLDYLKKWEISSTELRSRDTTLDIKFADIFLSMIKNESTLYTINHPLGSVFSRLLLLIFEKLNIEIMTFPSSYFYNHLANNAWWPVFQEVIEYHKIGYSSPMLFKSPDSMSRKFYDLNQFISASYKFYTDQDVTSVTLPENFKHEFEII
jgi:hypothetical protein